MTTVRVVTILTDRLDTGSVTRVSWTLLNTGLILIKVPDSLLRRRARRSRAGYTGEGGGRGEAKGLDVARRDKKYKR